MVGIVGRSGTPRGGGTPMGWGGRREAGSEGRLDRWMAGVEVHEVNGIVELEANGTCDSWKSIVPT